MASVSRWYGGCARQPSGYGTSPASFLPARLPVQGPQRPGQPVDHVRGPRAPAVTDPVRQPVVVVLGLLTAARREPDVPAGGRPPGSGWFTA